VLSYVSRRLGQALLTAALLAVAVALLVTAGSGDGGAALGWLAAAARLDFGRTADNAPVSSTITAALPATLLLALAAGLIGRAAGWGLGLLLALTPALTPLPVATWPPDPYPRDRRSSAPLPTRGRGGVTILGHGRGGWGVRMSPWRQLLRILALLADVGQGVPTFWLGGVLVVLLSVGLGLFPPGGIADPALPAFGAPAYLDLLHARPATVLGDLLGHLTLPALTLALAGLAARVRLVAAALPAELSAPYARVARAAGLSRRRLLWRAARPALPVVVSGAAVGLPALAGALVLVEYLFGWPGLGLLAYHAARTGDVATLGALLLLFGLVVIAVGFLADLAGAWADPRLRQPRRGPS